MNKILILMAVVLGTAAMNAQNVSGGRNSDREVSNGWNTVYVEYNPTTMYYTGKGSRNDINFNGFSLGYNHAFSLSPSVPIYLETGLAARFTFKSESKEDKYAYWWHKETTSVRFLSLKVPVNFLYVWSLPNTRVDLIPFAGLNMRGNLWGERKVTKESENDGHHYNDSKSKNLFNQNTMGKSGVCKRFQIGWQIGLKARFADQFIIGGSFGTDFIEFTNKWKLRNGTIMLGYTF